MYPPPEKIESLKKSGNRIIGCFPLYPPRELLHSMGFVPFVLWGLGEVFHDTPESGRRLQAYVCSPARHCCEYILSGHGRALDALFMYNACDTLRNLPEIIEEGLRVNGAPVPRFFKLHVPAHNYSSEESSIYSGKGILRLIRELESETGNAFSMQRFRESVECYREIRVLSLELESAVRKRVMSFADFCELMISGCYEDPAEHREALRKTAVDARGKNEETDSGPGVVVSGILPPSRALCELIENSGLRVAGNDIALLRRSYGYTPPVCDSPEQYYSDFYSERFPCTTTLNLQDRRPERLMQLVRSSGASGFIFLGEKFCEYEYLEFPFIEKCMRAMDIPVLNLESAAEDAAACGNISTRLETFAGIIKVRRAADAG